MWAPPTGKGPWGRSGEVGTFCVLLGVWVTKMQPIGKLTKRYLCLSLNLNFISPSRERSSKQTLNSSDW